VKLPELATQLARGRMPADVEVLKRSPIRSVVRSGDVVLKVLHKRAHKARREALTLARARALDIAVPELIESGEGWIATRFIDGRPAERRDLNRILPAIHVMHARGMLHRDLHLGNVRIGGNDPVFLDTQKAWFLPRLPGVLARWELGYFAFSLGEPLPEALGAVRFWYERRAQSHWRSRNARCLVESSGFTAFRFGEHQGFRRRCVDAATLEAALTAAPKSEPLKDTPRSTLHRVGGWIVKRHRDRADARAAWLGGWGLELRGIGVARPLAWAGPWIVMEDAGETLLHWVESELGSAAADDHARLVDATAGLLAQLHRARIYHPDLKANNICWRPGVAPKLIDYAHVRFGRPISRRRCIKNLAQLNAALPDVVSNALRERAFEIYLERAERREPAEPLKRAVIAESLRRRHRWSGC